jgi:nitrogen fixation-related uncharacterized protein
MEIMCKKFLTGVHFLAALILVLVALLTMGWSVCSGQVILDIG